MEQSFANENVISGNNETIEMCMNDVVLEDVFEENPNVQTKISRNPKNGSKKIMKENLKKLHGQRKIWKPYGITSLRWIFYCVNDNANTLLSKSNNWNKSKNSNEEMIDILL